MAAKWHEPPRDALDTLTLGSADLKSLESVEQLDYLPFDPIVKRTEGTVRENGKVFKTTKGAPHVLLQLVKDEAVHRQCDKDVDALGLRGIRSLAVAKTNDEGQWEMLGLLTFLDPPRFDTKDTIHRAMAYGVEVSLLPLREYCSCLRVLQAWQCYLLRAVVFAYLTNGLLAKSYIFAFFFGS